MTAISDAAVARLLLTIDRPDAGSRYEVHDLIGQGGMGSVYRATDNVLGRDVALKVLSVETESPELAQRLASEARTLAGLEHPGIISIHDAAMLADGRPFYVMRLVRGARLADRARTESRGDLLRQFVRVCDAVAFAHARGVLHRDLTPWNVMIGEFGEVLVLDWGLATAMQAVADGVVAGTPGFMAPEQLAGRNGSADARADVFGLGATLKNLLATRGDPVPRPLSAIIEVATAPEPAARYATVEALRDDILHWLDAEPVRAYRETLWERLRRQYERHQALVLLLASYLVVRLLIFWWRRI